ncbi:hypothetical protein F5146DRAFT_1166936 [Armillaria mellea]|nr:hypothetical protein F5146DRAFT_1166936 [Armillaria mellea]
MANLSYTLGSLLLGGLFSAILTGMMSVQSLLYFKLFPKDKPRVKTLVTLLCSDKPNTSSDIGLPLSSQPYPPFSSTCSSLSESFGKQLDTRSVDCHPRFSPPRYALCKSFLGPDSDPDLQLVLVLRPEQCTLSIETYSGFRDKFNWVFSAGLGLSSAVDILITGSLLKLLHTTRKSSLSFDHIIDSLILYTLECGAVTCAATIASMICWLTMNNLVFLGLHFVISKLYSNSLLATLITRYELRNSRDRSTSDGIVDLDMYNMRRCEHPHTRKRPSYPLI